MRLFVAIEVPRAIQSSLAVLQKSLASTGAEARWVRPDTIHLTLKFLGEVDPGRVGPIANALEPIRSTELILRVHGIGFFPNAKAPRNLWAGISSDRLAALASDVDAACNSVGFPAESRSFRPHLTLARAPRKGNIGSELVRAATRIGDRDFGSFRATLFFLYQSRLRAGGHLYEKMAAFPLAPTC